VAFVILKGGGGENVKHHGGHVKSFISFQRNHARHVQFDMEVINMATL
jgi:hypothetical protein